ncbi:MAG: sugar kinase, partial [Bacillus sp. (in: firmicutes)]
EASDTIGTLLPFIDICSCGELDAIYLLGIDKANDDLDKADQLKYYYSKMIELYPNIRSICSTFRTISSASTNTLQGNYFTGGEL